MNEPLLQTEVGVDLSRRLEAQRILLKAQDAQDEADKNPETDKPGWRTKLRDQWLRPGDIDDSAKISFALLSDPKAIFSLYQEYKEYASFFYNFVTCMVLFWNSSGYALTCCREGYLILESTVVVYDQLPPPPGIDCMPDAVKFYYVAAVLNLTFGITGFLFAIPPFMKYMFMCKEHKGNEDCVRLFKREFILCMAFYNWAVAIPNFWLSMNQTGIEGGAMIATVLAYGSIINTAVDLIGTTTAIFLTPLWKFIQCDREARTNFALMGLAPVIVFPFALSCLAGVAKDSASIPVVLGIVSGSIFVLALRFWDSELLHPTVLGLLFVMTVALNIIYFFQAGMLGLGAFLVPIFYLLFLFAHLQDKAVQLNKERNINDPWTFPFKCIKAIFLFAFSVMCLLWIVVISYSGSAFKITEKTTAADVGCCKFCQNPTITVTCHFCLINLLLAGYPYPVSNVTNSSTCGFRVPEDTCNKVCHTLHENIVKANQFGIPTSAPTYAPGPASPFTCGSAFRPTGQCFEASHGQYKSKSECESVCGHPTPAPAPDDDGGPSYYEDPINGCNSGEEYYSVPGASGSFCSPPCDGSGNCPAAPSGISAQAQCALTDVAGDKYCALVCGGSGNDDDDGSHCGDNATCKPLSGSGICTYDDDAIAGKKLGGKHHKHHFTFVGVVV
jgi:hypothetical protein